MLVSSFAMRAGMALCCFCLVVPGIGQSHQVVLADFVTAQQAVPEGWKLVINAGEAEVRLAPEESGQALHMRSRDASFSLQKRVHIPLQKDYDLVWQWKVTHLPSGGDFRQPGTDDQAAQLLVAFSNTQVISYIWDSTVPKGTSGEAPAPLFMTILALVMRSGSQELGTWITERRNLIEDFRQLFGEPPKAVRGVRIQINSQHTDSLAEAYWKSVVLTERRTAWHAPARRSTPRLVALEASQR